MNKIVVAMLNYKGGVGKTTLAIILTQMALIKRRKVLAIDLDPQKNFTYGLSGIEEYFKGVLRVRPSIDPGPEEEDLGFQADWTVLDCPIGLGDTARTALEFSDVVLVPVRPDFFSLANLDSLYSFAEENGKDRNQLALVKVGYDLSRLSRLAEAELAEKQYPVAGRVPLHRQIPYNITKANRIWSTGLGADARAPYEQLYSRIVNARQQMENGNLQGAWANK